MRANPSQCTFFGKSGVWQAERWLRLARFLLTFDVPFGAVQADDRTNFGLPTFPVTARISRR
ncbi:hypothetical protein Rmet_6505 [Cupriavidus metallidurans CH34]|uniref:Uncharacterized protein n=1 Tax=Cupriavidus metallidurans (strain ATCC 43123 / DSM 2839 / NBRC 102507 / CH34) TaxID=266264 RepID=D3DXU3_CUPMC|nr:hypothetical protein Rmet_6505 [Cupriavidus metallidurans CH34]